MVSVFLLLLLLDSMKVFERERELLLLDSMKRERQRVEIFVSGGSNLWGVVLVSIYRERRNGRVR